MASHCNKKSCMVQIGQTVIDTATVKLFKNSSDRGIKADFCGCTQRIAQIFQLHGHASMRREVAVDHALSVNLQDAAVGQATGHGLLDLGHAGATLFAHQQGLGYRANGDAYDHLVSQFGQLPSTVGADVGSMAKDLENRLGAFERRSLASHHDGQRALLHPVRAPPTWGRQGG